MKRRHERILIYVYIAMVMLCLYLNYWTTNDVANIMVNTALFTVVGIIFVHAYLNFRDVNKIMQGLNQISKQIKSDFDNVQDYLWDIYKEQDLNFGVGVLNNRYKEYQREMKRLSEHGKSGYRCSIEDFINHELIDSTIRRTMMNLVAGTMTGLGILGTFIGLSFGLQNFSTGTAQEISDSIGPLMEGIKVAFHTSIYGMIFSLCFHYVYKKKLEEANRVMDYFLEVHQRYVMPDSRNDAINLLLYYQKQMMETMNGMAKFIEEQSSKSIKEVVQKQLEDKTNGA